MLVAKATAAAAAADKGLVVRHILDDLARFRVADQRAKGHEDLHVRRGRTVELLALTVATVFGNELAMVTEVKERGRTAIHTEHDVAAVAAVAARRAASRHVLFAVERHSTVAAIARLYVNFGFVNDTLCVTHEAPPRPSRARSA